MDQGLLVPDELVDLVVDRVNQADQKTDTCWTVSRTIPRQRHWTRHLPPRQKMEYAIDVDVPDETL